MNFDGKHFAKTGDKQLDKAFTKLEQEIGRHCDTIVSQDRSANRIPTTQLFSEVRIAFDAVAVPKASGCVLTNVSITPNIDATFGHNTLQMAPGGLSAPDINLTQTSGGYQISVPGQAVQSISRADLKAVLPPAAGKVCGLQ